MSPVAEPKHTSLPSPARRFATDKFFDNGNRISFQVDDNAGGAPHECTINTNSTWTFGFTHEFTVDGQDVSDTVAVDQLTITPRTSKMGSIAVPAGGMKAAAMASTAVASV